MKKAVLSFAVLVVLFAFTACGCRSAQDTVSAELGIDASGGKEVSNGEFHGDGVSCIALRFRDRKVLREIKGNSKWRSFPLDETVQALVYGVEDGTRSIGPVFRDGNGNPLVREIRNGYYILTDRQQGKKRNLSEGPSFDVTVGLYDADANMLYCCILDT